MTKDEVIALAREAGLKLFNEGWTSSNNGDAVTEESLERFAALVAAHEREECARVCGRMVDAEYKTGKVDHNEMGWTQACAIAIRSRT